MAKQNAKSAPNDMQKLFDPQGYQDVFKTFGTMNERLMSIAVEAGTRSTDVASDAAKETFANLRELSQVRDEPTAYGNAYTDFVQKQADLFMRTAEAFGNVTQKAGNETSDLASKAGEEITSKVAANAESATQKVSSAANKAA
jgi:hypothetical protein